MVEQKLKHLLDDLIDKGVVTLTLLGHRITAQTCFNRSKLWLSAVIYDGGDYLPESIRGLVNEPSPVPDSSIPTFVSIDEKKSQLLLNYVGLMPTSNVDQFKEILDKFSWDVEEWCYFLEDFGQKDLVYARRN